MKLHDRLRRMTQPIEGEDYFFVRIVTKPDGERQWRTYTHWVGWAKRSPLRELRAASKVKPAAVLENCRIAGWSCYVVNDLEDYFAWYFAGGGGLIRESVAQSELPRLLEPREVVALSGHGAGFAAPDDLPEGVLQRAPSKRLRMKVLKRDQRRCKVCGRSPTDHVDIELHAHHIRPWAKGGLTEEANLITLCHTCHGGLDPHWDPSLESLTGEPSILELELSELPRVK